MEFDKALVNPWETDYQMTVKKYTRDRVRGSSATESFLEFNQFQVHISGWDIERGGAYQWIYKEFAHFLFMDNEGGINPELVTEAVISGEEYQKLIVLD